MLSFNYIYTPKFQVTFNPVTRTVLPWFDELSINAQNIARSTNKPLYVFMSGGIDSELVARMFLLNDIPFQAITLKHSNGANSYDTKYADRFCCENGIKQHTFKLNFNDFITRQISRFIQQGYKSTNIYNYMQLLLLEYVEELGGFGVGGAGEQVYYNINDQLSLKINPSYVIGMDWCKNNSAHHQWWFNLHSPELYASYMQIDLVKFLLNHPLYFKSQCHGSIEKTLIYHAYFPDMQQRQKTGGFQNVGQLRNQKENELRYLFPELTDQYIKVTDVKSQLGVNLE